MTSTTAQHPDLAVGPDGVARCAWPGLAHADYRPHVTVGLYGDVWPLGTVHAQLAAFSAGDTLRLRISRISLFGYASGEIGGPLTRIADYDFAHARCIPAAGGAELLPFPLP